MTRVMVTGAAGFLGSHLVDALICAGHDVSGVDNLHRGRLENIQAQLDAERIRFQILDIRDYGSLVEAMRDVEVVFHLAAQSTVMGASTDVDYTLTTNVTGTYSVLGAASEAGARKLVFASSREVYGESASLPVREDYPLTPKNVYGASKVAGEALCSAWRESARIDCQVLRFGNLYGPRDTGRVIPRWLESAFAGEELTLYGGGEQVLDFLWVGYAVEALLAALEGPSAGPINVASGQGTSLQQVAGAIQALFPDTLKIKKLSAREQEVSRFVAHVGRMGRYLGVSAPSDPLAHVAQIAEPLQARFNALRSSSRACWLGKP